ncbi:DinB family protein [Deinococcus sp. SDU3-2]|uniref:DinB family protein n=1 Tax=Deinococcus terrestris TaxID=2651870 RepID=A0A7X1NX36_9DEIO|nr:DinB family protein [Deinococcus terrestris]MPY67441.1 DinB family protein [Deinococcus terrestris]
MRREEIGAIQSWLGTLDEETVSRVPAPGVWSPKQVLGHLVDSACNNHARWARMATEDDLVFPVWDQDAWNLAQDWQGRPWAEILDLWHAYNLHLAHFAALLPPERLHTARATVGRLNGKQPITLGELLEHYDRHLSHHLGQIWERVRG